MKLLGTFGVLVSLAAAVAVMDIHPLSDENIALINQKASTWRAGKNFEVKDWERVKRISSGVLPRIEGSRTDLRADPHDESEEVPETFDAREAWPTCDSIKQIRDQSNCGSCWAFGAVEAMSDRICIHSNGKIQKYVSAEDLLSCCWIDCGLGCYGGRLPESWEYWQTSGIVTGGLYNSSQGCQDYSMEPCEHYVDNGHRPQCEALAVDTPDCSDHCYDTSLDYDESKTYGQDVYTFNNEKQIQLDIYKNGPLESSVVFYDDLPNYKSGVYQVTSENVIGGHAIKILGWGVESGTKYWLVANSWNEDWGDKGFFKILRGVNHCGIETGAVASLPKL